MFVNAFRDDCEIEQDKKSLKYKTWKWNFFRSSIRHKHIEQSSTNIYSYKMLVSVFECCFGELDHKLSSRWKFQMTNSSKGVVYYGTIIYLLQQDNCFLKFFCSHCEFQHFMPERWFYSHLHMVWTLFTSHSTANCQHLG